MIWIILLIIASLLALIFIAVIFTPLGISLQFSNTNDVNRLNAFFFLLSSFFVKIEYDFTANVLIIRFLGCKLDFRKKDNGPTEQQDGRIGKKEKKEKKEKMVEVDSKSEGKKTGHNKDKAESDTFVVPSGAADVNPDRSNLGNGQYQSSRASSTGEAPESTPDQPLQADQKPDEAQPIEPEPQQRTKPEQKEKIERLTDKITRIKNRINRQPAVFFLKQEKLRYRVWRWIVRILKSILRIIAIRRLLVRTELVFTDPALGGKLFGYCESIRHAAALYSKKINLYFRPLFIQGDTRIEIDFRATTSLWKIGYPLLVAVVTLPYMTFGIALWRFYWLNRQQKKADEKRN